MATARALASISRRPWEPLLDPVLGSLGAGVTVMTYNVLAQALLDDHRELYVRGPSSTCCHWIELGRTDEGLSITQLQQGQPRVSAKGAAMGRNRTGT